MLLSLHVFTHFPCLNSNYDNFKLHHNMLTPIIIPFLLGLMNFQMQKIFSTKFFPYVRRSLPFSITHRYICIMLRRRQPCFFLYTSTDRHISKILLQNEIAPTFFVNGQKMINLSRFQLHSEYFISAEAARAGPGIFICGSMSRTDLDPFCRSLVHHS